MSVTRQLVELHGGTIRVESEASRGARFIFTLPVAADTAAAPSVSRLATSPITAASAIGNGNGSANGNGVAAAPMQTTRGSNGASSPHARVLVVDDDAVNARVLESFLVLEGYVPEVVNDGHQALAAALRGENPPDLILLDVMMPGLDGFTVCERIRRQRSIDELPIILVTAKSEVGDVVAGLAAGANDFLSKPVARDELLTRVRTHLALTSDVQ